MSARDDRKAPLPLEALLSESAESRDGSRAVLVFEAGGATYGLDAAGVEVVVSRRAVTPLPYPPEGVVGVASVRGRMRLVVALGADPASAPRMIALHGDAQLAVLADRIAGVVALAPEDTSVELLDPERLVQG
jgi:chemotaxis signal transduction protein